MNSNCSNLLDMRNLQDQVKKTFCHQKLFWPFTVWINCSSDLKNFADSRPSASNFKSFSRSLEQFFLTAGQNNFGNKIPILYLANFFYKWSFLNYRRNSQLSTIVVRLFHCCDLFWHCKTGQNWLNFKVRNTSFSTTHRVPFLPF